MAHTLFDSLTISQARQEQLGPASPAAPPMGSAHTKHANEADPASIGGISDVARAAVRMRTRPSKFGAQEDTYLRKQRLLDQARARTRSRARSSQPPVTTLRSLARSRAALAHQARGGTRRRGNERQVHVHRSQNWGENGRESSVRVLVVRDVQVLRLIRMDARGRLRLRRPLRGARRRAQQPQSYFNALLHCRHLGHVPRARVRSGPRDRQISRLRRRRPVARAAATHLVRLRVVLGGVLLPVLVNLKRGHAHGDERNKQRDSVRLL